MTPSVNAPTTPVVGTNGGKIGAAAVWTGTNVLGNATDAGFVASGLNLVRAVPALNFISATTPATSWLQIVAGAGASYWITPGALQMQAAGDIQFNLNGVLRWDISNGYGGALIPGADNANPIGVTNAAGVNTISPSYVSAYQFRPVTARSTINGSTSGSIVVTNPFTGSANRKVIIVLQNLTGTASFSFSQVWSFLPGIFAPTTALAAAVTSLTTSGATITGSGTSGVIILEGF